MDEENANEVEIIRVWENRAWGYDKTMSQNASTRKSTGNGAQHNHVRDQRRSFSVLRPDSCIVINQHRENRKHVGERRFTITLTLLNSSGIVSSWRTFVRGPVIDPELVGRWTSRLSDSRALSLKIKWFKKGPRKQWSIHTLLEGHWCTLRENEHHASV